MSERQILVVEAGFAGNFDVVLEAMSDADAAVRELALGAMSRLGKLTVGMLNSASRDVDFSVRRRAAELAARFPDSDLLPFLRDEDSRVVETAAWAAGEHVEVSDDELSTIIELATVHSDALVREAAAAALGAIGDERGLPAILHACNDKPAIRRRAVLALAPFGGPEVDAAIARAKEDRDWQVRQSAEDIAD